jgi:hypothetical protein
VHQSIEAKGEVKCMSTPLRLQVHDILGMRLNRIQLAAEGAGAAPASAGRQEGPFQAPARFAVAVHALNFPGIPTAVTQQHALKL